MNLPDDSGLRARKLWIDVRAASFSGEDLPAAATPRGIVDEGDAVDALVQVFSAVEDTLRNHGGKLPPGHAGHILGMLMVAHDYIRPLPSGGDPDWVTGDVQRTVEHLRLARLNRQVGR